MPIEKINLMNPQKQDAETMLEDDNNKDVDLMREYAKQLNGEIEDHDDINYREN